VLSIGLASHNSKLQVPSHIPSHKQFVPAQYLKSQEYLETINQWSEDNKMQWNVDKSKMMIFNFTRNYPFTTNISHNGDDMKIIDETKLLGIVITKDLKWHRNTAELLKRANARMRILHKIAEFSASTEDIVHHLYQVNT
jgi:hypothetical protein